MSRKFLCLQIEKVFQYTTYIPNLYDIISSLLLYNYGKSLRPSDFMPFTHLLMILILDIITYLKNIFLFLKHFKFTISYYKFKPRSQAQL